MSSSGSSPTMRLLRQAMHYATGSVLVAVAGMLSFPFLTRMFAASDYGMMSLVGATITLCVSAGKLGVQHSIIRYHPEVASGKGSFSLQQLYATSILGMLGTASLATGVLLFGSLLVPSRFLGGAQTLFAITSALVLAQVLESVFVNAMRSKQMTVELNKYQVLKKYGILVAFVTALILIAPTLEVFYAASVIAEILAISALALTAVRAQIVPRLKLRDFSLPLYRKLVALGLPMMVGTEISGMVLMIGDRYVIGALMGRQPLGQYAAAYNLCQYLQSIVMYAVSMAFTPIYLRVFEEKGAEATAAFVSRSLGVYLALGAAVVAGFASVASPLMMWLAGESYASAANCMPWVIAGMVLDGTGPMLTAGLQIRRRTAVIMWIVVGSAALNIALNLILVPRIGILGSAIATTLSYLACAVATAWAGRGCLDLRMPWPSIMRAVLASVTMYCVLSIIPMGTRPWMTVLLRAAIGVLVFSVAMALLDAEARALLRAVIHRRRASGPSRRPDR